MNDTKKCKGMTYNLYHKYEDSEAFKYTCSIIWYSLAALPTYPNRHSHQQLGVWPSTCNYHLYKLHDF